MKTIKLFLLLLIFLQISCKSQTQKINELSFVASRDTIDISHIEPVINAKSNYVALMPFGLIKN